MFVKIKQQGCQTLKMKVRILKGSQTNGSVAELA